MKLYVMRNGCMTLPKAALVNDGSFSLTDSVGSKKDPTPAPILTFLIETEEGLVLFDSGNTTHSTLEAPEEECPLNCLAWLGVKPENVRYVICSHLHSDHTGYLKYFTNAQIVVHQQELDTVRRGLRDGTLSSLYIRQDAEDWFSAGLHWMPVNGTCERQPLVPGVELLKLGRGHAAGMLGALVHLPNSGNIILSGDAAYCKENMGPPPVPQGILLDEQGYRKTINYLAETARQTNADIWFGHDYRQATTMTFYREGFYE